MPKIKKSVLYEKHLELTDKSRLAAFAGYLMPLWYSSISDEHQAVRSAAGLFDCTHMGTWRVAGADAAEFIDLITTNRASQLAVGSAQYSYILNEAGEVLDDIIVYRRGDDDFMLVVNAANNDKIAAWLTEVPAILRQHNFTPAPDIRDLRDPKQTSDCRVDLAMQGPASEAILLSLADETVKQKIKQLEPFRFIETNVQGIDLIISRTGYTGAKVGYELFVHPDQTPRLWGLLLEKGGPLGLKPCGLGARDSLRIEAGLPLYGHELAGEYNISPFAAGYGWAVKLDKDFFIGRDRMRHESTTYKMAVQRLELPGERGVRPVRPGDAVLTNGGDCAGWVLSCAKAGKKQIALTWLARNKVKTNDSIGIYYTARNARHIQQGRKETVKKGEILDADIVGTIVERMEKF
ncbi:MAG: glycine cleavage system aminomethyltransferase GcvT [Sedimentisphaerales bacterium]|nr:glycine cleavage system aminomethyltransferase GcvT [Sedimentisphaerales bacterium]